MRLRPSAVTLAWLGLIFASLFWAGNSLVARAVNQSIPPFSLSFWRWLLALLLVLPFVARPLWQHRLALRRAGWRLAVLAGLGISAFSVLLYYAAQTTAAINITLLGTCLPLMLFLGSGLLLGEWPARRTWWGMGLAALGLLVLISAGSWQRLLSLQFKPGDLWMLLAVLSWALYSLLLRRWAEYLAPIPALVQLAVMMALGMLLLLPLYLFDLQQGHTFALSFGNLAAIAYTALCASIFAYLAWNYGIKVLGAAKVGLSNYLMPVFTAVLGWVLLDEGLHGFHWAGAALIFSGLLLANRRSGVQLAS